MPEKGFCLGIKINSVEFQKGGFTPEDCATLCEELEKHGFDFVELSGGTYEELGFSHKRESTRKREAFFLDFADLIAPRLKKTKAYVVGGLRTASGMTKALGSVHGVSLGRPVAHEADLPSKMLSGEAKSAIDYKLDEQDFGITNVAAGTQYVYRPPLSLLFVWTLSYKKKKKKKCDANTAPSGCVSSERINRPLI